jgi:hypothetical protein
MASVSQLHRDIAARRLAVEEQRLLWRASLLRCRQRGHALITSPRTLALAFGCGLTLGWLSGVRRSAAGGALRYVGGVVQPMLLSAAVAWWQGRRHDGEPPH